MHPLVRSRDFNLYGQLQYDHKQLRDRVDASAIRTDRHLGNSVLSLSGDLRDALLSGGTNIWSLGWTSGLVGFDDAPAQANDAATVKTQGRFSKWNANFSRLQGLTAASTLYLYVAGQRANANLDSSEKMTVGGPYTVRAYDMGAVSGDNGYQFTAEFRRDLGQALRGQWQAVAFVDGANVTVNKNPWVADTNTATLRGAGLGLNWANASLWNARTYIASRLGSAPALVPNASSTRAWIEISKGL
jgi:hemolysin activation/secretion protein